MPLPPLHTGVPLVDVRGLDEYVALSAHHLVQGGTLPWGGAEHYATVHPLFELAKACYLADPPADPSEGLARASREPYLAINRAIYIAWGITWPDETDSILVRETGLDERARLKISEILQVAHLEPRIRAVVFDAASRLRREARQRIPTREQFDFVAEIVSGGLDRFAGDEWSEYLRPGTRAETGFDLDPATLVRLGEYLHSRFDRDIWLIGHEPDPAKGGRRTWHKLWADPSKQSLRRITKIAVELHSLLMRDQVLLPDRCVEDSPEYDAHYRRIEIEHPSLSPVQLKKASVCCCRKDGRPVRQPVTGVVARLLRCAFANLRAHQTPASVRDAVIRS